MSSDIKTAGKVVGVKQSRKAIADGNASVVYIARDADSRVRAPIEELCRQTGVRTVFYDSMAELGSDCGIDVKAAVAVLLK